jgi:hypothetical protein
MCINLPKVCLSKAKQYSAFIEFSKSNHFFGFRIALQIKHAEGYISKYAHASKLNVTAGQTVTGGQKLALLRISLRHHTTINFCARLNTERDRGFMRRDARC